MAFRKFLSAMLFFACTHAAPAALPPEILSNVLPSDEPATQDFDKVVLQITELKFRGVGSETVMTYGWLQRPGRYPA
jgi:hypothetical protein